MKITIALLFGGKSTEHEVSIITGLQAYNAFDKEKYSVIPVYITKQQEFFVGDFVGSIQEYSDIPSLLKKSKRAVFVSGGAIVEHKGNRFGRKPLASADLAFLAVHGTNVEDGALQGYFQTLGIPYTGCDILSSAVGMDKAAMKAILKQAGVPVLDCVRIGSKRFIEEKQSVLDEIAGKIGFPAIVKPINLGSSIGIKIADNPNELSDALEHAFMFANTVISERAITHLKEINCAVLGDSESAEASECEEPVSSGGILDFNDKYTSGKSKGMASLKRKIPADITAEQRDTIRDLAVKSFKELGCSGVARIDFMIDADSGAIYFNEINTIPGSLAFYLWEPVGLTYSGLLDKICNLAFKRERDSHGLNFAFESNILSGFKAGFKNGGTK